VDNPSEHTLKTTFQSLPSWKPPERTRLQLDLVLLMSLCDVRRTRGGKDLADDYGPLALV